MPSHRSAARPLPAADPRDILFRVAGSKVDLGKEGFFLGTFIAPRGDVELGERATLYGALYGEKVEFKKGALIVGVPARDLFARLFVSTETGGTP